MSAPVKANDGLAAATGTVPVTVTSVEAESPLVSVATIVWAPGTVSDGMVTLTENDPVGSAVVTARVTGVLWSTIVTEPPGAKLLPLTVNEPPGPIDEVLVVTDAALGP
jgi:uncharacterized protein YjdB